MLKNGLLTSNPCDRNLQVFVCLQVRQSRARLWVVDNQIDIGVRI